MKRQGFVAFGAFVAYALSSTCPLLAQDEGEVAETEAVEVKPAADRELNTYYKLIRCGEVHGTVQVLRPRTKEPVNAVMGKYYPLGSVITACSSEGKHGVEASSAIFDFGKAALVRVNEGGEFSTREAKDGDGCRTIVLRAGRVDMILPRQMKVGEFQVAAPHFTCKDLSGESTFEFTNDGHNDDTRIHLKSGLMAVEGPHYSIAQMRAGDTLRITTRDDNAYTLLDGQSGIYMVKLDQGIRRDKDPLTQEVKDSKVETNFEISPKAQVKIWRRKAKVGGNTVVSTMAMDATGAIKTRRVFAENRFNVNSGELVVSPKDTAAAKAAAEQGAEAEETTTVAPADVSAAADDSAAAEEPASDASSSSASSFDDDF